MPRKPTRKKPTLTASAQTQSAVRAQAQRIVAAVLGAVGSTDPLAGLPLLIDHKTAAAMLSIHPRSLDRLVAGGHLTPVTTPIEGRFYTLEDLTAYVARCKKNRP